MRKILPLFVSLALVSCSKNDVGNGIIIDDRLPEEYAAGDMESILHAREIVCEAAENFEHVNRKALDRLFPGWEKDGIRLTLTAGTPTRYDAYAVMESDSSRAFVLNLPSITQYGLDDEDLISALNEQLSYELTRIIMKERGYGSKLGDDYVSALNRIALFEGFAGFLSYNSMDLRKVDWKEERALHFEPCRIILEDALAEEDPEQQSFYIRKAGSSYYYDRFAAVSSMLYLSKIYDRKGLAGLKRELNRNPKKLCKRIVRNNK